MSESRVPFFVLNLNGESSTQSQDKKMSKQKNIKGCDQLVDKLGLFLVGMVPMYDLNSIVSFWQSLFKLYAQGDWRVHPKMRVLQP